MTDWIDVKDRLPSSSGNILVTATDGPTRWVEVINAYVCPEYGNLAFEYLDDEDFPYEVAYWKEVPKPAKINQCDGCQAGLPLDEFGTHKDGQMFGIGCTKHRY